MIRLFLDSSFASKKAKWLMEMADIEYNSLPANGPSVPGVEWDGYIYAGLQGIRQFISFYRSIEGLLDAKT